MLRNYFKIMVRNFWKRKAFTLINLFGLTAGIAICLLLVLYIQNELGYDEYQTRGDQVYRLALERKYPGRSAFIGNVPKSIGQAIKNEFPGVKESTRLLDYANENTKVKVGEKTFTEKSLMMADSNFFQVFTGIFLQGDVNTALQKPGTAVLNETTAKKYFGSAENAMNKQIIVNEFKKCIITGVCRDWPDKSHFQFNLLITTSGENDLNNPQEYVYFGPYCYLLLDKNTSAAALEAKLPIIVQKYVAGRVAGLFGESYDKFIAEGNGYRYYLQPIKKIHLNSNLDSELKPVGSMRVILLFAAIGAFILFLACINFINLSTAISIERAREVGIRKTFGSRKTELMKQFLSESVFFSLASAVIALLLVFLLTPSLNKIAGINSSLSFFLHPLTLLLVFGFSIFLGVIAGFYPALVLSSFKPMMVLRGKFKSNKRGIILRNGLVVFQFSISVILIICTIVVNKQMHYMLGDELGFKKDHIVRLDGLGHLRYGLQQGDQRAAFMNEISKISGVVDMTESDLPAGDDSGAGGTWVAVDNNASRTQKLLQVDYNYLNLFGLQLKEGRFFSKELATDSLSLVINERAAEDFGLKNPIGARLISKEGFLNSTDGKEQNVFTIIGVIKDFHFQSLRKKIAPLIFVNSNKFGWGSAGVLIKGDHFKTTIAAIENTWKHFDPKDDFRFSFLDESVAAMYKAEQTELTLFTIFSLLAIVIACIGLFGLASYSTMQRTKEIGIRKVLGAMPGNIIMILSKDFLILIAIASLVAFPIGWWAMYKWLQNFSYRIDISWWIFILAGSIAATIAMLTISYQAIKAAVASPVKSLKSE